jgi:hypothetical protein
VTPLKLRERNRLDHILPQGYLEGFTVPSSGQGHLWVYNTERGNWFRSAPGAVAAERGFYDYSEGSDADASADQAFAKFETNFPPLVRELVKNNFSGWTKHCDFLVRYAQMLRARSTLFRQEVLRQTQHATFLRVEEVLQTMPHPDKPGQAMCQIRYSPYDMAYDQNRNALLKNLTITRMRAEIAKGAGEFDGLNWHLRLASDVTLPVITGDNPVAMVGFGIPSREEAAKHPDTLFVFPVCWQACLIGTRRQFDETDLFSPTALMQLYGCYLGDASRRFAYSPHRVELTQP